MGPKCAAFGCWNYTGHRSGLCLPHRSARSSAKAMPGFISTLTDEQRASALREAEASIQKVGDE
jgi:hypothetical protein